MLQQFMEMIRTVVIYMLLVSAVTHLLPSGEYKKYLQFFAGVLLVILVVRPLVNVVNEVGSLEEVYDAVVEWQVSEEYAYFREQLDRKN